LPSPIEEGRELDEIMQAKARPSARDLDVRLRGSHARPGRRHRGAVTQRVAVEDARLTPLRALGDNVQLLPVQRVKGVCHANRTGRFARVSCS